MYMYISKQADIWLLWYGNMPLLYYQGSGSSHQLLLVYNWRLTILSVFLISQYSDSWIFKTNS